MTYYRSATRNWILISIFFTLLSPCASFSLDLRFAEGVTAFKAGKLEDARKNFLELENDYPGDPSLLLNLGLIAQKEKRNGAALALWRKGLVAHPTNDALSNAIEWTKSKLPKTEIAHEIDGWEELRKSFLIRVSPFAVSGVTTVFLLLAGWFLLRWWGARRRALDLETSMPPAPISGIVFGIFFALMFSISTAIFIDRLDTRGTVVGAKSEVRSAPEAAATVLFQVFEGMEVIVRNSRKVGDESWRRITYPGGMTGWVHETDVLTSADASNRAWGQ